MMRAFSDFIALSCLMLAALSLVLSWSPLGPSGTLYRCSHIVVAITAFAVGLRWRIGPWPKYTHAVAFVIWADVAVSVVAVTLSSPQARLATMLYMGLVGVFVGFVLGWRLLLIHCSFGLIVIAAITGWAVWMEGGHAFYLFAFFMPAVTWVVFVPMGGGVLISSGRRALRRTVRSAQHDPLTGLLNRRGMHVAAKNTLGRVPTPTTLVAAVCDIDGFKKINDERGHAAGDLTLVAVARTLESVARRGDIAARIGGDEMVLLAFVDKPAEASAVVDRLRPLTQIEVDGAELNVSIGVATDRTDAPHFMIDDVIRHADAAMYKVKRSGVAATQAHGDHP